jgi:hypothetical protein
MPSVNYIYGDGTAAVFVNGTYYTDQPDRIATLQYEIAKGHPHIYQDADESKRTIDSEMLNPEIATRARYYQEFLAEQAMQAAAGDPTKDLGNTEQQPLKPASSVDIAPAASGGNGQMSAAKLVDLANLKVGS